MVTRVFSLILLLLSLAPALFSASANAGLFANSSQNSSQNTFLPADQAFSFSAQQQDNQLTLSWQISPGYYLYRQQTDISAENASLAPLQLPAGEDHQDEFFGKTEIWQQYVSIPLTINQAAAGAVVNVTYQGCAADGFCYPEQTQQIRLTPVTAPANGATATSTTPVPLDSSTASASSASLTPTAASPAPVSPASADPRSSGGQLPFNPLWALLIGIGIAFTPCVLPMYPLISGIVLGGKQRLSTPRALWLGFVYVQGMALTYTLLGIIVAMAGLQFQTALQSPWLLISLSVIFALLALSMFGLFTLQLPSALQTRLTLISNRQQGGATWGVFSMGAIGGLICSPCTTAPLSAILLYIAQSGNLWQGGGTLYLYALGMGLPLMLVTTFGNHLLPRSGAWMEQVKIVFGFIILALPIFLLERVLGEQISLLLWALLAVAFFAWGFIISLHSKNRWVRLLQISCLAAALIAVRPLQDWVFSDKAQNYSASASSASDNLHKTQLNFTKISNINQLDQALQQASGKPIMLDLYADWCVACKEFEKYTFSNPQVQQALANTVLLQIDMTRNSPENTALLKRLNVLGLPTILFFSHTGDEQSHQRVTGFMNADNFLRHLAQLP